MTQASGTPRRSVTALRLAIPVFIAFLPISWLLLVHKPLYFDWQNHLWIIAYTGEYFRQHFTFPTVWHTNEVVGIPTPLFYGTLFYPIAGVVSAALGAELALRLLLVIVMIVQTVQVCRAVYAVYPQWRVAWAVGAIVAFAVYPLTNLYNRNDITEFVAVSLLIAACARWLRLLSAADTAGTPMQASSAWVYLALAAGTHPITAALGGLFFAALVGAGLFFVEDRRAYARSVLLNGVLCALVLSPWLYATARFNGDLHINRTLQQVEVLPIDSWWVRLLPFPFDPRLVTARAFTDVPTPYLDAQINVGLLVLVGFLLIQAWRQQRREATSAKQLIAAGVCLLVFALAFYSSVSRAIWTWLPRGMAVFQVAYRIVTYADLALFVAAIFLLWALRPFQQRLQAALGVSLAVAVTLMTQSVMVKFTHVAALQVRNLVPGPVFSGDLEQLHHVSVIMPWFDYTDLAGFAGPITPAAPAAVQTAGSDRHFGESIPVLVPPGSPQMVTNIAAFPWNRIVVDGRDLPAAATYTSERLLSFPLTGEEQLRPHLIGYRFAPERAYSVFRTVAAVTLLAWMVALAGTALRRRWRAHRSSPSHALV